MTSPRSSRGSISSLTPSTLIIIAMLVTGIRCGNQREAASQEEAAFAEPSQVVAAEFVLSLGTGGGFTGRWDGYRIASDGSVWSWSGIGIPTDSSRIGTLPADSMAALSHMIDDSGFYADSTHQPGNVTAFLEISSGNRSNRVTWIPTVEELEPPQSPTEALYRRARLMAASLKD